MAIDAEEFYARMPKPDAPQPDGILGAVQEAQDRAEPAAGNSCPANARGHCSAF